MLFLTKLFWALSYGLKLQLKVGALRWRTDVDHQKLNKSLYLNKGKININMICHHIYIQNVLNRGDEEVEVEDSNMCGDGES